MASKWRYQVKYDKLSRDKFPYSYGVWDIALEGWTSMTRTTRKVARRSIPAIYKYKST